MKHAYSIELVGLKLQPDFLIVDHLLTVPFVLMIPQGRDYHFCISFIVFTENILQIINLNKEKDILSKDRICPKYCMY